MSSKAVQPDLGPEREPGDESEAEGPALVIPKEPGTAVARQESGPAPEAVGTLPAALQSALRLRAIDRQMAAQIAQKSWGKELDTDTRKAIGQYLTKWNIDVTEIDVLGGNIYRNARFYLSRLAQLVAAGLVEYAYADHVVNDLRFTALMKSDDQEVAREAAQEHHRRMRERLTHAIPEDAQAAVVFRVKLRSLAREVTGAKWIAANPVNDPVGKAKPVETCESRAARRCMRQLIPNLPKAEVEHFQMMDAELVEVGHRVGIAVDASKEGADEGWVALPGGARIRGGSGGPVTPVAKGDESYGQG